jgi:serine/threonine-protein kinase
LIGLEYFKQAIALDPEFALAYTGYAFANFLIAFYSYAPGKEIMEKMKEAVETAIRIDNSRSETYLMLAQYYIGLEWNWREAEKNYLKAIELNPNFSQPHALYGMACLTFFQGKFDEGEKYGRIAIKLEPLSAIDHADLAWTLYTAHKFDDALAVAKTGIELDANSFLSQRLSGLCYMALKRYSEAIDTLEHLIKISNRNQHAINSLIWVYCSDGNLKEAKKLMNELNERSEKEYIAGTNYGLSAAWLGDIDTAVIYLENAFQDHDPILITLKYSPYVPTSLRSDPRFQNLLQRIGFL